MARKMFVVGFATIMSPLVLLTACSSSPDLSTSSTTFLEEQHIVPHYRPDISFVEAEDLTAAELKRAEDSNDVMVHQRYKFADGSIYDYTTVKDRVIEGDMILSTVADLEESLAVADEAITEGNLAFTSQGALERRFRKWTNNIMYFESSSLNSFTTAQRAAIQNAMQHITNKTNLGFRAATSGDRIYFAKPASGCNSFVGRIGGRQKVNLANECFTQFNTADNFGTVVHELSHAAGFMHEHQRVDRKIVPNKSNLTPLGYSAIVPIVESSYRTANYDYASVMHYVQFTDSLDFVKDPDKPMFFTPNYTGIVASTRLTATDIYAYRVPYK